MIVDRLQTDRWTDGYTQNWIIKMQRVFYCKDFTKIDDDITTFDCKKIFFSWSSSGAAELQGPIPYTVYQLINQFL